MSAFEPRSVGAVAASSGTSLLALDPPEQGSGFEPLGFLTDKRAFPRHPVESRRPIAVRCLESDDAPAGPWFLADIVNISEGGLCLLASDAHNPAIAQRLQLDLRTHPGFGQLRAEAHVRWCTPAHFALTFGVFFREPLTAVPGLAEERRAERRDPNLEEWAQQSL